MITLISKDFCGSVLSWCRDANGRVLSLLISYGDVFALSSFAYE